MHTPPLRTFLLVFLLTLAGCATSPDAVITGERMRWHPLTLTFDGPDASETGTPNPFRDYRLTVTFTHDDSGTEVTVPGYFAADGDAAETGATAGTKWQVRFTPHLTGRWTYTASFRSGPDVALSLEPEAGEATAFDGTAGAFEIAETDKSGRDHRSKGLLRYVGAHYLRFDNGEWFVKGGADSPENLLAYIDFDSTYSLAEPGTARTNEANTAPLHRYEAHVPDWNAGDPTWHGDKGKGLIGGLNYLAGKGLNAFSFLTMNVEGDGKDVWPWTAPDVRDRFDVSKLAQWEIVFTHADSLGLFLHFKTQETENDQLLDGGELGPERRLYYRELIARFGHHHALNWNLGEENTNTTAQRRAFAAYIDSLDAYDHPIVIHTYPGQQEEVYRPLLGEASDLHGVSIQTNFDNVHAETLQWISESAAAGKPWVVANDEQGHHTTGVMPDGPESNQDAIRHETLWGNLMAGGAGVEYYFGYEYPHNDLNLEDWRSRDRMWDYTRHALAFFGEHLPFWTMAAADSLSPRPDAYVFARADSLYALYLPDADDGRLVLSTSATYTVRWYDPRNGGPLQPGSVAEVRGPGAVPLGHPPAAPGEDWVVLIGRQAP